MIDDYFDPGVPLHSRNKRLLLSDIERIRDLRTFLKNAKGRISEMEHNDTIPNGERLYEMVIVSAVQREINIRQQMAFCSEFGIQ